MTYFLIFIATIIVITIVFAIGFFVGLFAAIDAFEDQDEDEDEPLLNVYCFQCEFHLPVKEKNGRLYCANCGLYH